RVVVNDIGASADGRGRDDSPAAEVAEAIRALGGEAVTNADDVADWEGARGLIEAALSAWGRLDVLVNNAGFLRDRMFASVAEGWRQGPRVDKRERWDASELGPAIRDLLARAAVPGRVYGT